MKTIQLANVTFPACTVLLVATALLTACAAKEPDRCVNKTGDGICVDNTMKSAK